MRSRKKAERGQQTGSPLKALKIFYCLILFNLVGGLAACSVTPNKRVLSLCPNCQQRDLNTTAAFPLIAFSKNLNQNAEVLHIYLEGDGLPWTRAGQPNTNPNSKKLTALTLMVLDETPSIYINRPCYGYTTLPENCTSNLWTQARYSEPVIQSIRQAVAEIQEEYQFKKIVLIGHSGGGTIAMILASRIEHIQGVVTIGANLDHKLWTNYFHYLPLSESLNAANESILDKHIFRWHFAGDKDKQVPARVTEEAAAKDAYSRFILKPEYDHICCWANDWPQMLREIDNKVKSFADTY